MNRLPTLSQPQLADAVHQALKQWAKAGDEANPLSNLHLFQAARRTGDKSDEQIANDLIYEALKILEAKYGTREADLLRLRFHDQVTVGTVALRLNLAEVTVHKKQREAIDHLAGILQEQERRARADYTTHLERRLTLPPWTPLIGVETASDALWELATAPDSTWLLALEGMGGLGKTALANALLREIALTGQFYDVAWVSAKQQEFWPDLGLRPIQQAALDEETLIDALLVQLGDDDARACPPPQKRTILSDLLKKQPYLLVIDNLETVADYEAVLPLLLTLTNPSKIILTTRYRPPHAAVTHFRIEPLSQADTFAFLKQEARLRGLPTLAKADPAQLECIYEVVGGNPLALKLVAGQIHALPLSRVLDNLKAAQGQTTEDLYTYIYWQAWQTLSPAGRQLLVAMPLAQNGLHRDVARESDLTGADLDQALQEVIALSLVEVNSEDIERRRYHIHRLTETFLLNEVIKWTPPQP